MADASVPVETGQLLGLIMWLKIGLIHKKAAQVVIHTVLIKGLNNNPNESIFHCSKDAIIHNS